MNFRLALLDTSSVFGFVRAGDLDVIDELLREGTRRNAAELVAEAQQIEDDASSLEYYPVVSMGITVSF